MNEVEMEVLKYGQKKQVAQWNVPNTVFQF